MIKNCEQCGVKFKTKPSYVASGRGKFCSRECRDEARRNKVTRVCEHCGIKFKTIPSYIARGEGKFCSRRCWEKSRGNKVPRVCEQCGIKFKTIPSLVAQGGGKYCSRGCYAEAKRNKVTMVCKHCGIKFKISPSHVAQGGGIYCGRKCYAAARRTGFLAKNGYMKIGINGKKVYEHRLVMAEALGRDLTADEVVHHIDGDRLNNAIENLQLFPNNSAHTKFHRKEKGVPK